MERKVEKKIDLGCGAPVGIAPLRVQMNNLCPICHQKSPCPIEREKTALMQSWPSGSPKVSGESENSYEAPCDNRRELPEDMAGRSAKRPDHAD